MSVTRIARNCRICCRCTSSATGLPGGYRVDIGGTTTLHVSAEYRVAAALEYIAGQLCGNQYEVVETRGRGEPSIMGWSHVSDHGLWARSSHVGDGVGSPVAWVAA
jgi:hypothetical protein